MKKQVTLSDEFVLWRKTNIKKGWVYSIIDSLVEEYISNQKSIKVMMKFESKDEALLTKIIWG